MSFVNLMASDVWSEADITAKTEALIHTQFSREQELILNRKATGAVLGQYTLTPSEGADLARYAQVSEAARQAGTAARVDMALLNQVLELEAAHRQLAADPADGDAQASIDAASTAAVTLYELRKPEQETGT